MGEAHKGHDLSDVKAVLEQLQRLDLDAAEHEASLKKTGSPIGQAAPARASLPADLSTFDRKRAAIMAAKRQPGPRRHTASYLSVAGALIVGAVILLGAGIIRVPRDLRMGVHKAELQRKESETALLAEARRFLSEGDVTLARSKLLSAEPERRAEVAFMLAQSYDPNYLASLPKISGLPDRFEAERWYKKWHELAVQSGLEMDSGRLQRIINAMR